MLIGLANVGTIDSCYNQPWNIQPKCSLYAEYIASQVRGKAFKSSHLPAVEIFPIDCLGVVNDTV